MRFFTKNRSSKKRIIEEWVYERVADELSVGEIRRGLWAKALGLSGGDTNKCESIYIQLRAESIVDEAKILNEACEMVARKEAKRGIKPTTEQQEQVPKVEKEQASGAWKSHFLFPKLGSLPLLPDASSAWEPQLLLSIHNEDYDRVHAIICSGVTIQNEEFAEKCKFLLTKCSSQDLIKLVTFFLKQSNY